MPEQDAAKGPVIPKQEAAKGPVVPKQDAAKSPVVPKEEATKGPAAKGLAEPKQEAAKSPAVVKKQAGAPMPPLPPMPPMPTMAQQQVTHPLSCYNMNLDQWTYTMQSQTWPCKSKQSNLSLCMCARTLAACMPR